MHGQLGQADVHRGHGDLPNGNAAQGGAAGNVRTVAVVLGGHLGPLTDGTEDTGAETVGAVFEICVEFHNDALAQHGGIAAVGQLRMVGMQAVGIVGADQEGPGQHLPGGEAQFGADPADGIPEHRGPGALGGAGAHLFTVQGAEQGDAAAAAGFQEALEAAPDAFQIVQGGGGHKAFVDAPYGGLLPDVQEQVVTQQGTACFGFQKGLEFALAFRPSQQGDHIGHRVPLIALVDGTVHVDGHIGNQQQIPVNVQKLNLGPFFGFHQHPTGNGQGTIQPGGEDLPAVALHRQPGILPVQFPVFLHLKGWAVGMGGADEEAPGAAFGDAEGQQSAASTGYIILSAGGQRPIFRFVQAAVACRVQGAGEIGPGMVLTVGGIQKTAQGGNAFVHGAIPFRMDFDNILLQKDQRVNVRIFVDKTSNTVEIVRNHRGFKGFSRFQTSECFFAAIEKRGSLC